MITIKKRVSLDFLGEDYKESYIVFKAIAVREYEGFQKESEVAQKDSSKALAFITSQLKARFIEGKIEGKDITADELEDLPADVYLECFQRMIGQSDPKA